MDGIKKIKQRISKDADAQVKEITKGVDAEIAEIQQRSKERMKAHKRHYQERTDALVQLLEQKTLAQARLDVKKTNLRERETIIDSFIEHALGERGKSYEDHLKHAFTQSIKQLGKTVTVTCNKKDHALVKKIVGTKATVKDGDVPDGIILTDSEGKQLDETLNSLLERKRNSIRQEVASTLGV